MTGPGDDDLRSRTDLRHERIESETALMELSDWLARQGDKVLAKLGLADDALGAIADARRIRDPGPRKRALRLVRTALRDTDVGALRQRIEALAYPAPRTEAERSADEWAARLLSGTEADVTAFVEAFPGADRQRLRQLVRNAKKTPEERAAQARAGLSRGLMEYTSRRPDITHAGDDAGDDPEASDGGDGAASDATD